MEREFFCNGHFFEKADHNQLFFVEAQFPLQSPFLTWQNVQLADVACSVNISNPETKVNQSSDQRTQDKYVLADVGTDVTTTTTTTTEQIFNICSVAIVAP